LLVNEVAGSVAVVVLVVLPWMLGGLDPTREDLTWALLLSFTAAVASVFVLVLSIFDLASQLHPVQTHAVRDATASAVDEAS
jgi:fumarate reductase subunit D